MATIKFPQNCVPINRTFDENFLVDHLMSLFYYFTSFSHELDNIVEYDGLWRELNEIGKMAKFEIAPVLATCCATEILRCWVDVFSCVERNYADCFFNLYKNVTKHIRNINPDSCAYMWQYNLLQIWAEKDLFRLSLVDKRMNETLVQQLFADMVKALLQLGSSFKLPGKVIDCVRSGLKQLVQSSATIGKDSLKELLMPLLIGKTSQRALMGECLSYLSVRQYQFLCSLISRRILLNHRNDILDGMELHVAEKLLAVVDNFEAFEPLILVINKASLNCFHRDHERVLRLLSILLVRHSEKHRDTPWENLTLDLRKKIQLMATRFKSAMVNSYAKLYPEVLVTYGSRLLRCAPNADIKFKYLQIFQFYIKHCRGEGREALIRIFDENMN